MDKECKEGNHVIGCGFNGRKTLHAYIEDGREHPGYLFKHCPECGVKLRPVNDMADGYELERRGSNACRCGECVRNKAPWRDYEGNDIFEGDTIRHPRSGQTGVVIFMADRQTEHDQWLVKYDYFGIESRLFLQVNETGRASVVKSEAPLFR